MIYTYTSTEAIIASILTKTRLTDTTFADDMLEWLAEAMDMIRVRPILQPEHYVIEVHNNVGKLPCGLVYMDGLLYNGKRLREGLGVKDLRIGNFKRVREEPTTYFRTDVESEGWVKNEQNILLLRGDDIKSVESCEGDYYIPTPNHIQTSFKDGCVQLFYRKMPTDDKGYPLIPKEPSIKLAIEWWIMAQLCLAGYKHNDARMDFDYCEAKFEKYSSKGRRKLKYWSVDKREAIKNMWVNLIPPVGYYESFGVGMERPKFVHK